MAVREGLLGLRPRPAGRPPQRALSPPTRWAPSRTRVLIPLSSAIKKPLSGLCDLAVREGLLGLRPRPAGRPPQRALSPPTRWAPSRTRVLIPLSSAIKKPLSGLCYLAVREGFEPSIRCRIHTFQACSFNHSDTSPRGPGLYTKAPVNATRPRRAPGGPARIPRDVRHRGPVGPMRRGVPQCHTPCGGRNHSREN